MKASYKWIKRIKSSLNCTDFAGFIFERESRNDAGKNKIHIE